MNITCKNGHKVTKAYQILLCGCPLCEAYTYHCPITGELTDWPKELRDAEIEKAKKAGFERGVEVTIAKIFNLTGMTKAELLAEIKRRS